MAGERCRCHVEGHVRPVLIVVPSPGFDGACASIIEVKQWTFRHLSREPPVERFDVAVAGGRARAAEVNVGLMVVGPQVKQQSC